MFQIKGLDHIVIKTNRLAEMLTFYCEILNCQVEHRQLDIGLTQLRAGINMIDLLEVDNLPADHVDNIEHFCLQIHPFSFEELSQYFAEKGIEIYRYGHRMGAQGMGDSFYLKDPQGNELELKEYAIA